LRDKACSLAPARVFSTRNCKSRKTNGGEDRSKRKLAKATKMDLSNHIGTDDDDLEDLPIHKPSHKATTMLEKTGEGDLSVDDETVALERTAATAKRKE
jgi:hypothetical protein